MAIEIKTIPQYQVAFIHQKGSYTQIPEVLGKVVGWLMTQDVEIQMPIYGTYYNSPHEVTEEELDWEVGAAFTGKLKEGTEDIHIKTIPEHQAVSTIFQGPYGEAASVYMDLIEYTQKEGYQIAGAPLESYLNSPDEVAESELLTEIQFPVVKIP
ncbi:GyrI-like domain-containing protein [Methanobacterium formicicum]|uniref:GyrI-like domain-containing protein n=1 Tax=Methanobacterium formicicum TaxID=2162 RepID=UPI002FE3A41A